MSEYQDFHSGDIVTHKLTGEKLIITRERDKGWEAFFMCRTPNYVEICCQPKELEDKE